MRMPTAKQQDMLLETRAKTRDYAGLDQYGSNKKEELYIDKVSISGAVITLSNGVEYFFSENNPDTCDEYTELHWLPEDQMGDWDVLILADYGGGFSFVHGS